MHYTLYCCSIPSTVAQFLVPKEVASNLKTKLFGFHPTNYRYMTTQTHHGIPVLVADYNVWREGFTKIGHTVNK